MVIILVGILTMAALGVIFLAAIYRLWRNPPKIDISVNLPDKLGLALTLQHVPAELETKPKEVPIPVDVLEYIGQESELHAQDARKRRVRELYADTQNWDSAFRLLQLEDNRDF